jgi:predicted AAA+ superfamily ATPase
MQVLTLWPFSQGELRGVQEGFLDALFEGVWLPAELRPDEAPDPIPLILRGGYPEAVSRGEAARRVEWFGAYLTTLLQRDVRELARIEGLTELPRVLALLAARVGSLANVSDLSRACGIPQTTLKRYLTLLEATFQYAPLPAWSGNLSKKLLKSPKVHLGDTGIGAYLQGVDEERLYRDRFLLGPLLENFVVTELRKQATWSRTRIALHHLRTLAGREVDVIAEVADGRIVGIEVKAAGEVASRDFKGLRALKEMVGDHFVAGMILYQGTTTVPFGDGLFATPLDRLWAEPQGRQGA